MANVYVKIKKWNLDETKSKTYETKTTDEQKHMMSTQQTNVSQSLNELKVSKQATDVYDIGVKYYYWDSFKKHKHHIKANHPTLKEEMLQNKVIPFDIKRWNSLNSEAEIESTTDIARTIVSNGYFETIYRIKPRIPFSVTHICALKLYTDY
eukprot:206281_1